MTEEFSAGGIVFKKEDGKISVLVSQHSAHHGWVFPKGHIEEDKNETAEEAALREVREETGIIGIIVEKLSLTDFWYVFEGERRHKTVQYFLMNYVSGETTDHDYEMEKVEWIPVDEVEGRLTYDGDKKSWEQAHQLIEKYKVNTL